MAARLMGRGAMCDGSRESESEQREYDSDCDESDLYSHIQRSSVCEKQPAGIAGHSQKKRVSKRGTTPLTAPNPDATAARHPDGTGGRPSTVRSL